MPDSLKYTSRLPLRLSPPQSKSPLEQYLMILDIYAVKNRSRWFNRTGNSVFRLFSNLKRFASWMNYSFQEYLLYFLKGLERGKGRQIMVNPFARISYDEIGRLRKETWEMLDSDLQTDLSLILDFSIDIMHMPFDKIPFGLDQMIMNDLNFIFNEEETRQRLIEDKIFKFYEQLTGSGSTDKMKLAQAQAISLISGELNEYYKSYLDKRSEMDARVSEISANIHEKYGIWLMSENRGESSYIKSGDWNETELNGYKIKHLSPEDYYGYCHSYGSYHLGTDTIMINTRLISEFFDFVAMLNKATILRYFSKVNADIVNKLMIVNSIGRDRYKEIIMNFTLLHEFAHQLNFNLIKGSINKTPIKNYIYELPAEQLKSLTESDSGFREFFADWIAFSELQKIYPADIIKQVRTSFNSLFAETKTRISEFNLLDYHWFDHLEDLNEIFSGLVHEISDAPSEDEIRAINKRMYLRLRKLNRHKKEI